MENFKEAFAAFLKDKPWQVFRAAEARGEDRIEVAECMETNRCQDTYSVSKTFAMTALGLLWDRGELSLGEKAVDILRDEIPERGVDERWKTVTVEMLLRHRAGLPGGFLDIDVTPVSEFGRDFLAYTLTYPLAYTPGEEERYSDGAYYLVSRIAEKKSGKKLDDFLWEELLWKLGFQEAAWSRCPMGHPMGATGLYISAEDMVKLGFLYANGGLWRGERLLSKEWIGLAFEKQMGLDRDETGRMYYKGGMYGQKLVILPEEKRAAAIQAYGADTGIFAAWIRDFRA